MRCLKIQDKWIQMILTGEKTWEIRRQNTKIREKIALGNTKTKRYEGYAVIVDVLELSIKGLKKYNNKHQANDFLEEYAKGRKTLFAWQLANIVLEKIIQSFIHFQPVHGVE